MPDKAHDGKTIVPEIDGENSDLFCPKIDLQASKVPTRDPRLANRVAEPIPQKKKPGAGPGNNPRPMVRPKTENHGS